MAKEFTPPPLEEEELQLLYTWVDDIPLSRPKKNITRDFSDGVLMAEIARHFFPKLVQIHNYSAASSYSQKMYNWNTLNQKVLRKLDFMLSKEEIDAIVKCKTGAIEFILKNFQVKITQIQQKKLQENKMRGFDEDFEASASGEVVIPSSPPPMIDTPVHVQQTKKAVSFQPSIQEDILAEKDAKIKELTETVKVCKVAFLLTV